MVSHVNVKRLAAMCAAAASLSTFGLAGSAMAVETPTTSDTGTASITLKATRWPNTRSRSTGSARMATSPPARPAWT